ncbi:protein of unknown function [Candidatus Methylomirabilis oxygeniifera]|uniref:Uncharacterized protein n=1 Tax=Methylomirabilis oxygeniifera TaxID=671143 RepID=D5MG02_METO1|nr:protein of unknown function [Candidatus Methylomirabilis oxyfera]
MHCESLRYANLHSPVFRKDLKGSHFFLDTPLSPIILAFV